MAWSDKVRFLFRAAEVSRYLSNWRILQRSWYENNWPSLKALRLHNFPMPDALLLQFLLNPACSPQSLILADCSIQNGVSSDLSFYSWGPDCEKDNIRRFMEGLKGQTKIRRFRVYFSDNDGIPVNPLLTEKGWLGKDISEDNQIARLEREPGSRESVSDHVLLNFFLRG